MKSYLEEKVASSVYKTEITAVGIRHADHVAPFIRKKLALTTPTSSSRSVGIVRSRTEATEFSLVLVFPSIFLHHLSYPSMLSSASVYIPPTGRKTEFHTHMQQQVRQCSVYFNHSIVTEVREDTILKKYQAEV
jgi:hypothetical protein